MKKHFQLVALAALALLAGACSEEKKDTAATQTAIEKPRVKLAQAGSRDVAQTEEYTATVESDVKNNISSNSAALRIETIYVDEGDMVSKGQLLVQMDASDLQQLKLQIENQRVEFGRTAELYKVGGASKAEYDNAKTALEVNETMLKTKMENTRLVSPIHGVVTKRNFDNGDLSGGQPILTIESLSPVKMTLHVSETYYPKVSLGMAADVKLDVYGDEAFKGKVTRIAPVIDAATHTFSVEVTLTEGGSRVRPGMFARTTLAFGTAHRTVVPDQAVVKQAGAGDRYVYVYKDGKVSYNKVELGRRMGNEYEVISGVPANAQVVVAGQNRLADGAEVEVVK